MNAITVANPFADDRAARATPGALVSVEQQRAIAEVQARMIIARSNPRDPIRCMDAILQDCTRTTLAESSLYQYAKGGSAISGPSIRLAENMARRWGNIASGIKEISRGDGYSECVAYAWDLETGFYDERQFQVRHWRDTKQGGYRLTDERDIYELIANMGQRRKRAVLLTVIPGDVTEAAQTQCEQTLAASADVSPDGIKKVLAAFEAIGVTRQQIETRCQCRAEAIRPAQVLQLRKIYTSLKDEMSLVGDWFAVPEVQQTTGADKPANGNGAPNRTDEAYRALVVQLEAITTRAEYLAFMDDEKTRQKLDWFKANRVALAETIEMKRSAAWTRTEPPKDEPSIENAPENAVTGNDGWPGDHPDGGPRVAGEQYAGV
jgi:hypothetical protein